MINETSGYCEANISTSGVLPPMSTNSGIRSRRAVSQTSRDGGASAACTLMPRKLQWRTGPGVVAVEGGESNGAANARPARAAQMRPEWGIGVPRICHIVALSGVAMGIDNHLSRPISRKKWMLVSTPRKNVGK